jgi:hypothetical protein
VLLCFPGFAASHLIYITALLLCPAKLCNSISPVMHCVSPATSLLVTTALLLVYCRLVHANGSLHTCLLP